MTAADRAVARLAWRELRRGAVVVSLSLGGLLAVVMASYDAADLGAATGSLSGLVDNPAVRALYGSVHDLTTPGGFGVWRGGGFVLVIGSLWSALTATRLLRGAEDLGLWDLVLGEPVVRARAVAGEVAVLGAVCVLAGAAVWAAFLLQGESAGSGALFGAGTGLCLLTYAALGVLAAQLLAPRRRATAGAVGGVLAGYLVRMVADASGGLGWLRWLTPFGWVEELRPFAGDRLVPLVPLVVAPALLLAAAFALLAHRDLGEGTVRTPDRASPRVRLLGSPWAFAWRQRLGGLLGWSVGTAFYGLVIGAVVAAFTDFLAGDEAFRSFVERFDLGPMSTPAGFVGVMDSLVAVGLVLYGASSLRRSWEEESEGRLDLVQASVVTRSGWLSAELGATSATVVVAALVAAVSTWIGAVAGGADLSLGDALVGVANVVPLVALFVGGAVLLHGVRPSVAFPVTATLVGAGFVVAFFGPGLGWPAWLVDATPFTHLAAAPAEPVAWAAAATMAALAVALAGVGFVAYARRDLG